MTDFLNHSNYYYKFPNQLEERLDFAFYHPNLSDLDKLEEYTKYQVRKFSGNFKGEPIINHITSGTTPKDIKYLDKGIMFLGAGNIQENRLDLDDIKLIDINFHNGALAGSKLKKNDILISMAGTIGRCAVFDLDNEANINQAIAKIEVNQHHINPHYLVRYLNSHYGQMGFVKHRHDVSQPNINLGEIQRIKLILPPKEKQEEILNQLKPIESQARTLEKKSDAFLKEAENNLLSALGIELRKLKKIDCYIHFIKDENRLDFEYNNPKYDVVYQAMENSVYPIVSLGYCANFLRISRNPLKTPDVEFEYVDIGNIDTRFGEINSVTMLGKDATSSRMRRVIYKRNIIVSTTRPTRNAIAIVPKYLDNQICSTGFAVLQCKENILPDFLFLVLRSKFVTHQFQRLSSGSGYPEINQEEDLQKIMFPKPDNLDIQQEIVEKTYAILKKAKNSDRKAKEKWQDAKANFEHLILKEQ